MKNKCIMLPLLLILLPTQLCALTNREYCSLAAIIGFASWGLYERVGKNQRAQEVKQLEENLELYKNDALSQEYLSKVLASLDYIDGHYTPDLYKPGFTQFYKDLIEGYAGFIERTGINPRLRGFEERLAADRYTLLSYRNTLNIKIEEWQKKQVPFLKKAKEAQERCAMTEALLAALAADFEQQRNFIHLAIFMEHSDRYHPFKDEAQLDAIIGSPAFNDKLHLVVRKQFSETEYHFPYVSYAEKLKRAKIELESMLGKLTVFEADEFQWQKIEQAKTLVETLERVFVAVVSTPIYQQQRAEKPEFDKQEQERKRRIAKKEARLKSELQEREARANAERSNAERILIEERRHAQEVTNRRAQIECEQRQCDLKKRELEVTQEQIRQQVHIANAVNENERKWEAKYAGLQNQASEFQRRIARAKDELGQIEDALNVGLHVDNEHQQGVTNYLNLIRSHLRSAKSAL